MAISGVAQEGLGRFDGVRFVVFDRRNTPEIKSNMITALCADSKGRLWIGTGNGAPVHERGISALEEHPQLAARTSMRSSRTAAAGSGSAPKRAFS